MYTPITDYVSSKVNNEGAAETQSESQKFDTVMRQILAVSKEELKKREKAWRAASVAVSVIELPAVEHKRLVENSFSNREHDPSNLRKFFERSMYRTTPHRPPFLPPSLPQSIVLGPPIREMG